MCRTVIVATVRSRLALHRFPGRRETVFPHQRTAFTFSDVRCLIKTRDDFYIVSPLVTGSGEGPRE
jgi:hypothetical protein